MTSPPSNAPSLKFWMCITTCGGCPVGDFEEVCHEGSHVQLVMPGHN